MLMLAVRSPAPAFTWAIWFLLFCLTPAGCDNAATPYLPPLEGVILWDDGSEPRELEGSTVEFGSAGNVVAQAGLVGDGTFMLDKQLPPGNYQVRLKPPGSASGKALPARYQDFEKSELSYTAPADAKPQHVTFKLSKSGR